MQRFLPLTLHRQGEVMTFLTWLPSLLAAHDSRRLHWPEQTPKDRKRGCSRYNLRTPTRLDSTWFGHLPKIEAILDPGLVQS